MLKLCADRGSAAGRTPGGGTSKGLLRAGLSEAVFKNVMDETLSKLQERMREAQVGAIRQSFMQEVRFLWSMTWASCLRVCAVKNIM